MAVAAPWVATTRHGVCCHLKAPSNLILFTFRRIKFPRDTDLTVTKYSLHLRLMQSSIIPYMRNNYLHSPGCCEPFGARVRSPIRGETLQSKGETLQSEARVSAVKSRAHAWMRWQSPPFEGEAVAEWLEGGIICKLQNAPRNNGVLRIYRYRYQVRV